MVCIHLRHNGKIWRKVSLFHLVKLMSTFLNIPLLFIAWWLEALKRFQNKFLKSKVKEALWGSYIHALKTLFCFWKWRLRTSLFYLRNVRTDSFVRAFFTHSCFWRVSTKILLFFHKPLRQFSHSLACVMWKENCVHMISFLFPHY